jgi:hypothetical protein
MVSTDEDSMISLGGHGKNRGSNLIGVHFHSKQYQKMQPVSPPMMINVKQCMVREIFFVFQWWRHKKFWEPLPQPTDDPVINCTSTHTPANNSI